MRTDWGNIAAVVRREFLERTRKKSFIIMTLVTPVLFAALMIVPALIAVMQSDQIKITVIDHTGWAGKLIVEDRDVPSKQGDSDRVEQEAMKKTAESTEFTLAPEGADLQALQAQILDHKLGGILVLDPDEKEELKATYYAQNLSNTQLYGLLAGRLNAARLQRKLQNLGLDPAVADQLKGRVEMEAVKVEKGGKTRKSNPFVDIMRPIMLAMVIYIMVLMYGVAICNGVLEEKNSKVVEVILSAASPFELMMGKIVGIAAVGLLQYAIWFGLGGALYLANPLNVASASEGMWMKPLEMAILVAYFLLGFVFYASIYAAVGAVCTTQQEAQQWQTPVTFGLVIPFVLMMPTIMTPNAPWVVALSLFPVTSPITMLLRVGAIEVPLWQIGTSLALLALGTVGVAWAAAKVYRVGILMTGKRPSIPEVLRWIRKA